MKKILLLSAALLTAILVLACCQAAPAETEDETTQTQLVSEPATSPVITAYDNPSLYVTIPEFSQINVSNSELSSFIEQQMTQVLASLGSTEYEQIDSEAILGDSVNINYTGLPADPSLELSQSTLAGMTNAGDEEGFDLILGSGSFIEGFEEQLIGASAGSTVSVEVTFPDSYQTEELEGVDVIFEVTVNSVSRVTADERSYLSLSVIYSLEDGQTETDELSDFMEMKELTLDLGNEDAVFDTYFDASALRVALLGKNLYGTAKVELTLDADSAAQFGYNQAIKLNAMITIDAIITLPDELTDEMVQTYTAGEYTTKEAFEEYISDYCKQSLAYTEVSELAEFGEIASDAYDYLYDAYYRDALYQLIGDTSSMTDEELEELLTDDIKEQADEYAGANAIAEYRDRMIMALLCERLDFELDEDRYTSRLNELFEYYSDHYYIYLLYNGISTVEDFEEFFGRDYLEFQFVSEAVIPLLAEEINYID